MRYNTRKPDGWNNYKEMTEQCPAIIEVVNDATEDIGLFIDVLNLFTTKSSSTVLERPE